MIQPLRVAVFAAVMLKPLGALSADFVVWWEEGLYPKEDAAVAEVVAAFEQESGKEVELVIQPILEVLDKTRPRSMQDGPRTFCSARS